jgi:hypothetical protein
MLLNTISSDYVAFFTAATMTIPREGKVRRDEAAPGNTAQAATAYWVLCPGGTFCAALGSGAGLSARLFK